MAKPGLMDALRYGSEAEFTAAVDQIYSTRCASTSEKVQLLKAAWDSRERVDGRRSALAREVMGMLSELLADNSAFKAGYHDAMLTCFGEYSIWSTYYTSHSPRLDTPLTPQEQNFYNTLDEGQRSTFNAMRADLISSRRAYNARMSDQD